VEGINMEKKSLVRNAGDKEQVKKAGNREDQLRRQHLNDIRDVMNLKSDRRIIWWLINVVCHYDTDDFSLQDNLFKRNSAERNIGRIIKSDVYEATYEGYQLMERENWDIAKGE